MDYHISDTHFSSICCVPVPSIMICLAFRMFNAGCRADRINNANKSIKINSSQISSSLLSVHLVRSSVFRW